MLYGSMHTHFESRFDTANTLKEMYAEFAALGAKKVAVTEHGAFSSFEDLRALEREIGGVEIIPGVEGYFREKEDGPTSHLVLVAKDYEGYLSLCRILTRAAREQQAADGKVPVITPDNLKENVAKGHLVCTSACIAGPFGQILGLARSNLEEKAARLQKELDDADYFNTLHLVERYESVKKTSKMKIAGKKKTAETAFKKYGNRKAWDNILALEAEIEAAKKELEDNGDAFAEANAKYAALKKKRYGAKASSLEKLQEQLAALPPEEKQMDAALALYRKFEKIFGKKDFYFELQYHGLPAEKMIYPNVLRLARMAGSDNLIASNDIHLGVSGADKEKLEKAIQKRNVVQFTRFSKFSEVSEDDREYYIKTDEELKSRLLEILPEVVVDKAIANIEGVLSECRVVFPENEKYYPKFCEDENAEFDRLVRDGIRWRFPNGFPDDAKYRDRIAYESKIIKEMGYAGYHLIVQDYLNYARWLGYLPENEIADAPLSLEGVKDRVKELGIEPIGYNIGPGRGSCCGSQVCYLLGITDIDPIPYELLFERFLNPDRISMPECVGHLM